MRQRAALQAKPAERSERMFGYVKPKTDELLVREYEFYRATYCAVCRAMKKHTGALSNVTLSYDSVLLALVRMLFVKKEDIRATRRRCIAHPVKPRGMLVENEAIEYTARVFALFTYYKLADDFSDEGVAKRLALGALKPITHRARRKAGYTELSEIMAQKLAAIRQLEIDSCPSVDEGAALFGELLGEVFAHGLSGNDRLVYYTFGYHLGKFIYCADAAEDYEKDLKSGSYNPYCISYGKQKLTKENKEIIKCALLLECRKLEGAVNLMPFGNRATIENTVKNIVFLGLTERIAFLDGEKSEEEKEN
ncbi:MAG: hypothetical protein IIX96_04375 [Clostridia bacterium]|nr:hypothetical protein [Clostridia bacterium]